MMPSRGWHLARGNAPRLYQLQCRQLSSASRRIPEPLHRNAAHHSLQSIQWQKSMPRLATSFIAIRHASSTPQEIAKPAPPLTSPPVEETASAAPASTPPPPPASPSSFDNIDTISLDNIDLTIDAIPEQIGYLHSLGLTWGYGPTSMLEWTIEHLHIIGGLPWWGSIAATAVILRVFLFPLYIKASDTQARSTALGSVIKPIQERMTKSLRSGENQEYLLAAQQMKAIRARAGLRYRDQFAPLVFQGVFAYCGFKLIRAMVALPVPALKTEGPLWLHDLTLSDPYLLLPLAMAGTIHLLIRLGGESGAQSSQQLGPGMQRFMLYGMPSIIVVAMGFQSAALCVWFAAGGAMGITQSLILRQTKVRQWLGIAPLYTPSKDEAHDNPMSQMMKQWMPQRRAPREERATMEREDVDIPPSAPAAAAPLGAGKNAVFMNPTYQSPSYQTPNLRRSVSKESFKRRGGDIIDVQATTSSGPPDASTETSNSSSEDDMIQPSPPSSQGIADKAATSWKDLKLWSQDKLQETKDEVAATKEDSRKKLAKLERESQKKEERLRKGKVEKRASKAKEDRGKRKKGGK